MAAQAAQLDTRAGGIARVVSSIRADRLASFFAAVVCIQGIHVFEHIVQLIQVYALGVPEDRALGLLGEVAELQGTEEWLHLGFNAMFMTALVVLAVGLLRRGSVPARVIVPFFVAAVGLEMWHVLEHSVIISNVVANNGCPCSGILDARLGVSDTVLHFFYNAVAFGAMLVPFGYVLGRRRGA